jgi:hypothetical protein
LAEDMGTNTHPAPRSGRSDCLKSPVRFPLPRIWIALTALTAISSILPARRVFRRMMNSCGLRPVMAVMYCRTLVVDGLCGFLQNGHWAYFGKEKSRSWFFLPNLYLVNRAQVKSILPGNRETDFREEYRPNVHFAEIHDRHRPARAGVFGVFCPQGLDASVRSIVT